MIGNQFSLTYLKPIASYNWNVEHNWIELTISFYPGETWVRRWWTWNLHRNIMHENLYSDNPFSKVKVQRWSVRMGWKLNQGKLKEKLVFSLRSHAHSIFRLDRHVSEQNIPSSQSSRTNAKMPLNLRLCTPEGMPWNLDHTEYVWFHDKGVWVPQLQLSERSWIEPTPNDSWLTVTWTGTPFASAIVSTDCAILVTSQSVEMHVLSQVAEKIWVHHSQIMN